MIAALQRLQNYKELADVQGGGSLAAFKISSKKGGFLSLFSTHPDLEDRINRLKMAN
jgi:heat shock protein HtpX